MERSITANELKTKGVSALEEATASGDEAFITVRGKQRFVVVSVEHYNYLRECELEAAIAESHRDIQQGKVVNETIEEHVARITGA